MMDQRGGCCTCTARYAGGGAYDMSNMGQIMLRFRPIAPKPASADGSISAGGTSCPATAENGGLSVKTCRAKRRGRAVKGGGGASTTALNKRSYTRKKKQSSSPENTDSGGSVSGDGKEVKTLALLPEAPSAAESRRFPALWLSLGSGGGGAGAGGEIAADRSGFLENPTEVVGRRRAVVVRSWVKVECVTDAAAVGGGYVYGGMGRTDGERVRCLDLDTCPGFVTDGMNVVRWTNAAYRRMAAGGAAEGEVDLWVEVVEGAELPVWGREGFTCRVRVVTCGKEKMCQTVPCDVWRMGCGGFAWRLDTTAALSLGRL